MRVPLHQLLVVVAATYVLEMGEASGDTEDWLLHLPRSPLPTFIYDKGMQPGKY
jgi:hypothetical protein